MIKDISICFHTSEITACREFYTKHMNAKVTYDDADWYLVLSFGDNNQFNICFMIPQDNTYFYKGGTTLNFNVPDVDAEYDRLIKEAGLEAIQPLTSNPWGDRSFVMIDPIGNRLYIYSEIAPFDI